jgi:hypothetical protein
MEHLKLPRVFTKGGLWNRDHTGSSNIYKISDYVEKRITTYSRTREIKNETINQCTLPSVYNQTLCGYEKTQL